MHPAENIKGLSGVYCAIHRDSGKCYVGSSVDIFTRLSAHCCAAKRGSLNCFHRALREFGVEAFDFEVLERCERGQLFEKEAFYIALFNAASTDGFNTVKKPGAFNKGHSEVTKKRISLAAKGRKQSAEQIANRVAKNTGKKRTAETIQKLIKANLGKKRSPEYLAWKSKSQTGKKHTLETRLRLSIMNLGRKPSAETKAKMSESAKRRIRSAQGAFI